MEMCFLWPLPPEIVGVRSAASVCCFSDGPWTRQKHKVPPHRVEKKSESTQREREREIEREREGGRVMGVGSRSVLSVFLPEVQPKTRSVK